MLASKHTKKKKDRQKDVEKGRTCQLPRKKKRPPSGIMPPPPHKNTVRSASKEKMYSKQSSRESVIKKLSNSPKKISINFEIKNINIIKQNNNNQVKKVHHRKSASCVPVCKMQKSRIQKATHKQGTKSQDNLPSEAYVPLLVGEDDGESYVAKHYAMTKAGQSLEDKKKINQDSIFDLFHFTSGSRSLFGVCDGHGSYGHLVARFAKEILPENLQFFMIKNKVLKKQIVDRHIGTQCLKQAFIKTGNDLLNTPIDINYSGTTAVVILLAEHRLWCANIGDSRAVLYSKLDDKWNINPLSNDHKPQLPSQARRIVMNNGRIEPFRDEEGCQVGPYRVWLKHEDVPGLAMTRSFGDYVASTIGVTCQPQLLTLDLCKEDKFVVMGSDGLWQFLSNRQVLELMQPFYMRNDAKGGCARLIEVATKEWKAQDEVIDDISVVLLFFGNY